MMFVKRGGILKRNLQLFLFGKIFNYVCYAPKKCLVSALNTHVEGMNMLI